MIVVAKKYICVACWALENKIGHLKICDAFCYNLWATIIIIINDIYPGSFTHSKVIFREVLHPIKLE